ncbi:MAG: biotin synthase BioB [Syntrophobacteraceae bacterium CG23_combo_of_CG06-09_8_20_14_all_50_8]|nr:MAG: biotin synthase BioB [Syntrophobacteraceae bacterium CG23_combo_of_CG06-09_8_20_14_all_50_8]
MSNRKLIELTEKILEGGDFRTSYEEACRLAALPEDDTIDLIMCAGRIRRKYKGNRVVACSITNAKSGLCTEDCAFCAQSAHHETGIEPYPLLSAQKILKDARHLSEGGATEFSMVTSGYALTDQEMKMICRAAGMIKEKTDLTLCSSLGILTEERARQLKESGVFTYHHNLETARSYFDKICTTHDYEDDIQTVRAARAAGLKVCCGGILGLGETWEQRVELAVTLRDLDVDSIPINFLNPIPGTRMAERPLLSPMEALKCIALFRFVNPRKDITICGGREITLRDLQSWIFAAGANGLLVGNYLTTQGRDINADMEMIKDLGLVAEKGV